MSSKIVLVSNIIRIMMRVSMEIFWKWILRSGLMQKSSPKSRRIILWGMKFVLRFKIYYKKQLPLIIILKIFRMKRLSRTCKNSIKFVKKMWNCTQTRRVAIPIPILIPSNHKIIILTRILTVKIYKNKKNSRNLISSQTLKSRRLL